MITVLQRKKQPLASALQNQRHSTIRDVFLGDGVVNQRLGTEMMLAMFARCSALRF